PTRRSSDPSADHHIAGLNAHSINYVPGIRITHHGFNTGGTTIANHHTRHMGVGKQPRTIGRSPRQMRYQRGHFPVGRTTRQTVTRQRATLDVTLYRLPAVAHALAALDHLVRGGIDLMCFIDPDIQLLTEQIEGWLDVFRRQVREAIFVGPTL